MRKIFAIHRILIVVFALSLCSGFGLHRAGHGGSPEVWHDWAVFHIAASLPFLAAVVFHSLTHRRWYMGIVRNGLGAKSRGTAVLSLLFLLLSATGLVLLGVSGADSPIGLWHYKIGIATGAVALCHLFRHIPVLRRSVKERRP